MITAWDIYWVMQLDTLAVMAGLASFFGLILVPLAWAAWADRSIKLTILLPLALTTLWIMALLAAAFLPSTKTAAAMIVLPQIANNETIQREAGELYGIAKDALRELAKPDAPEPKE